MPSKSIFFLLQECRSQKELYNQVCLNTRNLNRRQELPVQKYGHRANIHDSALCPYFLLHWKLLSSNQIPCVFKHTYLVIKLFLTYAYLIIKSIFFLIPKFQKKNIWEVCLHTRGPLSFSFSAWRLICSRAVWVLRYSSMGVSLDIYATYIKERKTCLNRFSIPCHYIHPLTYF